jgi:tRNA nucleotidyltransferase (CCA-adding enzyme)
MERVKIIQSEESTKYYYHPYANYARKNYKVDILNSNKTSPTFLA